MRSLFLVLALPLASFALAVNHPHLRTVDCSNKNETTSNVYQLQDSYEGDTFFEYAEAPRFLSSPC
jgi:hypothetical protein